VKLLKVLMRVIYMSKSVKGKVSFVRVNENKGYYSLRINDEFYNGELSGFSKEQVRPLKGKRVELTLDDDVDEFIRINDIRELEDQKGADTGSANSGSSGTAEGRAGEASGSSYVSPEMQCALKEACETVREFTGDGDVENSGEHINQVSKLANGYYGIMQDMAKGDEE